MHYLNKRKPFNEYLILEETNEDDVLTLLSKLKNNSSSGPTAVPNEFIKLLSSPLSTILCCIINRSFFAGHVPRIMKMGKQTPVHKMGDVTFNNYRPITVCSSLSKILEKVVRDRVMKFLKRVKLLNKCQFGFRNNHSTNHAIINLTESALEDLENGLKVGGVFLDVAKAFDTINHNILLRKLEYYGFRGKTLMWFESYIKNREYFVDIRKHKSDTYNLDCGIPQGGILAPILFIIYMNDITQCSDIFDFSIYADDTCLILGVKTINYDETMKTELENVVDWFSANDLILNFTKTDYLHFGPHHNKVYVKGEYDMTELHQVIPNYLIEDEFRELDDPDHVKLNRQGEFVLHELHKVCPDFLFEEKIVMPDGSDIFEPDNVKYLGVLFDNRLCFRKHILVLCSKINRWVGIFWKSDHLNIEAKKFIYNGLIEWHLHYGIVTWGAVLARNITGQFSLDHIPDSIKQLVVAQNKVLRAIYRKPNYNKAEKTYTSVTSLYKNFKALKLNDIYYYNLAILAHNYFYGNNMPEKLAEKFTKKSEITDMTTRQVNLDMYYKLPRLISTFKKPSIASLALWNILPAEIRKQSKLKIFKNKLKAYFLDKY